MGTLPARSQKKLVWERILWHPRRLRSRDEQYSLVYRDSSAEESSRTALDSQKLASTPKPSISRTATIGNSFVYDICTDHFDISIVNTGGQNSLRNVIQNSMIS